MYSAKKVLPVPLSPYSITGLIAGANACAREIASIIEGAKAIGSFDDGSEQRSGTGREAVTRFEQVYASLKESPRGIRMLQWETRKRSLGIFLVLDECNNKSPLAGYERFYQLRHGAEQRTASQ